MHLSRDRLVSHILLNIVLLLHELDEVCRVHIRLQLEEHLVKLGLILVFSMILINAHLLLHITVVLGHERLHLAHNLILTLGLYRFLVILQLSCKQIGLRILKLDCLLFSFCLISKSGDLIEIFESTILDLVCIDKPYIVLVILEELSMHLENLYLSHFLEVVADFEALNVTVLLELAVLE